MQAVLIGLGNMGVAVAASLMNAGHELVLVDKNPRVLDRLRRNESPVKEDGWVPTDKWHYTSTDAVSKSHTYLICVQTPIDDSDKVDLTALFKCVVDVCAVAPRGAAIVVMSTL